jgi:hypothetical protein
MSTRALLVALSAAALVSPLAARAAQGADLPTSITLEDPVGDVWLLNEETQEPVRVEMAEADVLRATAVHGRKQVRIEMEYADLRRRHPQSYGVDVFMGPERHTWIGLEAADGHWGGRTRFYSDRDDAQECDGLRGSVDYAADTVALSIPRRCLGRPDWVRLMLYSHLGEDGPGYFDNPHNKRQEPGMTRRLFHAPAPAPQVDRVELIDAADDVWADGPGHVLAPDNPSVDVTGAVIAHRPRRVTIEMTFVDLQEPAGRRFHLVHLKTPKGLRFAFLRATPRRPEGRFVLLDSEFRKKDCARLSHKVDYEAETVEMRIPRSCVGGPDWVRAQLYTIQIPGSGRDEFYELSDNPHNSSAEAAFTPKLYVP